MKTNNYGASAGNQYGLTSGQNGTQSYAGTPAPSRFAPKQAGADNDSAKNLPEKKFRAGPVAATIWANNVLDKDGKVVTFRTVSFERSYKDKNDAWKTTSSLRMNDLPRASLVLEKAFEYLALNHLGEETA
jgi:hypothetical protein